MPDALKNLFLFKALTQEEFNQVAPLTSAMTYNKGDLIFSQGDVADAMYLLKYGNVEVIQTSQSGEDVRLMILGAGSHFGEMGFLDKEVRSASARVLEHCEIVRMEYRKLHDWIEKKPQAGIKVYRAFAQFLAARLRVTSDKFSYVQEKKRAA